MPNIKRVIPAGSLVHVIITFVNNEYRLIDIEEKHDYLGRLGKALEGRDSRLLAFALMSTHIHLAMIAGFFPFGRLFRRIHPAFARWLNQRQKRNGPLLAERPRTYTIDILKAPRLIAYLHNNPVRAGVCLDAKNSTWTSHRAYLDLEPGPTFLDTNLGLKLCDQSRTPEGKSRFDSLVQRSLMESDDWIIGRGELVDHRKEARIALGSAVLLGTPHVSTSSNEVIYSVMNGRESALHPSWTGKLSDVLDFVSAHSDVSKKLVQSKSRCRKVVAVRRLFLLLAREALGDSWWILAGWLGSRLPQA